MKNSLQSSELLHNNTSLNRVVYYKDPSLNIISTLYLSPIMIKKKGKILSFLDYIV